METVRRRHQLGPGVFEQLQLVVEMVDGPRALTFGTAPPRAGYQHDYPQYDYED
jgi:hypothetical protein